MKKIVLMLLISSLFLVSCTKEKEVIEVQETNPMIYTITDVHYLSKSLYDEESEIFQRLLDSNDGKLIERMPEAMEVFTQKVIEERPKAVFVLGDITFNGERDSLSEMRTYFDRIQKEGIAVLAVTGNHDVNYAYSQSYFGSEPRYVMNISQDTFRNMMYAYGPENSLTVDKNSFSYLYPLQEDLYVLAIDGNTEDYPCAIGKETLQWMEEALQRAKEDQAEVVVISHQNVLRQSESLYVGYQLHNGDDIAKLLKKYNVKYVYSGHSHLQHTSIDEELVDICNESFALYPLSYGIVDISQGYDAFTYERQSVGVYQDEAKERFEERTRKNIEDTLEEYNVPKSIRNEMVDFACLFNVYTFTGEQYNASDLLNDPRYEYWKLYASESFWFAYITKTLEG